MFLKKYNSHQKLRVSCLLLCLAGTVLLVSCSIYLYFFANTQLSDVSVRSEDGAITVTWSAPNFLICRGVRVTIKDGENIVLDRELPPVYRHASYTEGESGKAYTVSAAAIYRDGRLGEPCVKENVLFLDYDRLPKLPLIMINTKSGKDPTNETAVKPDKALWGETQTNNEYLAGELLLAGENIAFETGVKIKIHGNTSAVLGGDKKPYKIVLNDGYDLLHQENNSSCKEWVLLSNVYNLNSYVGNVVSELCGMEWNMETGYVNVILNGDWKGCYCLTRAVGYEAASGLVGKTGYIFENDAYWWRPDTVYFKTANQVKQMAYTFKYPEIMKMSDSRINLLKDYMNSFEDCLLKGNVSYRDYIDEDMFARWILVRDVTGVSDAGGSNMYLYKYDFDKNAPTSSKVKMGPLWDFDTAFLQENEWSNCRKMLYFPELFKQESFFQDYLAVWQEISDTLYANVDQRLSILDSEALNESWKLENRRWQNETAPFESQREEILDWFSRRIAWMNRELNLSATE